VRRFLLHRRLAPGERELSQINAACRAPNLFLHGTSCPQPVCQRNLRIVCVVARLRDDVCDAHGGIDGGHGRGCRGCSGVEGESGCGVLGCDESRGSDRLSVWVEVTRLHLDGALLFRGCLA
jgi:hypothetical protein